MPENWFPAKGKEKLYYYCPKCYRLHKKKSKIGKLHKKNGKKIPSMAYPRGKEIKKNWG